MPTPAGALGVQAWLMESSLHAGPAHHSLPPQPRAAYRAAWPPTMDTEHSPCGSLGWEELLGSAKRYPPSAPACLLVLRKPGARTEPPFWEAGPPLPPALWLFTFKMNQGKLPPGQAHCCSKFPDGCQKFEILCECGNQLQM